MSRPALLKSGHITLRAPEPEDLEFMLMIENDSSQWDSSLATGPYSRYQLKQYIANSANDIFTDRQLRLMIEHAEVGTAGAVDLFNFDPQHNRAEIGLMILPRWRKMGIAQEAVRLLEEFSFSHLGLHQLYAYITANNTPCIHLFKKIGYDTAGVLKDWFRQGPVYTDAVLVQKRSPWSQLNEG